MYNEKDDQIFLKLDTEQDPTEFLLTRQPMGMIEAKYISKEEIRETFELGLQLAPNNFYRSFLRAEFG